MALDAAFDDGGQIVIGEFKSWGGFEKPHDREALRKDVQEGRCFPDRLAIHSVRYNNEDRPVSHFVFATSLKDTAPYTFPLGDLVVEFMDIANLLKNNVQSLPDCKTRWFAALDEAVCKVKTYVELGKPPSCTS